MTEEERGTIAQEEEIAYYKEMQEYEAYHMKMWEEKRRAEEEYYEEERN